MAFSTITVAGISPTLNILGSTQQLNFAQNLSAIQINNTYVPTSLISAQTNAEYRNYLSSGFRWVHLTDNTDTYGSLTLQSFVNAATTGSDLIAFNSNGIEVPTPTSPLNPATKAYVDGSVSSFAYASIKMASNASATTVTTGGTYYKVAGTTTSVFANEFSTATTNRLQYTGTPTINVMVQATLNATHNAGGTIDLTFAIFKNGSIASSFAAPIEASVLTTGIQPFSINAVMTMSTNDYIEVWVTSSSSTTDVTVANLNFVATTL